MAEGGGHFDDLPGLEVYVSSGTSFHFSDSSDASLLSTQGRRPRSRKRKDRSPNSSVARSRSKRLRICYSDRYRKDFNESLNDISAETPLVKKGVQSRNSRLGVTTWSTREKESFFSSIARLGWHDLQATAQAIGTKTMLEVYDFIRNLDEAKCAQHIHCERRTLLDASAVPAAFEISDECDAALEKAADAMAQLQRKEDEKVERDRHGNNWLLTPEIAKEIDYSLDHKPDGEAKVADMVPSAVILNLKTFLSLSSRLFMNSADQECNWHSLVQRRERPSIFFSAFSDIMNLVLGVTERLVQSVLFCAMSRIRAIDASSYNASGDVTVQDVKAAIQVLGMKANAHDYWVRLARRCKLDVVDRRGRIRKRKISGKRVNYDAVEAYLDKGRKGIDYGVGAQSRIEHRAIPVTNESSSMASSRSQSLDAVSEPESISEKEVPSSPALSDSKLTFVSPRSVRAQNRFDHDQLASMSALDHRNSLKEEQRLWSLLDEAPSNVIDPESVKIPQHPGPERQQFESLDNWRHEIEYGAEWETNDTCVHAADFARNRATWRERRRKVAHWEDLEDVGEDEDANTSGGSEEGGTSSQLESNMSGTESLDQVNLFNRPTSSSGSGTRAESESDLSSLGHVGEDKGEGTDIDEAFSPF